LDPQIVRLVMALAVHPDGPALTAKLHEFAALIADYSSVKLAIGATGADWGVPLYAEAREALPTAIGLIEEIDAAVGARMLVGKAHYAMAVALLHLGDLARGMDHARIAVSAWEQSGDTDYQVSALLTMASFTVDPAAARHLAENALDLAIRSSSPELIAAVHADLAEFAEADDDTLAVRRHLLAAVAAAEDIDDAHTRHECQVDPLIALASLADDDHGADFGDADTWLARAFEACEAAPCASCLAGVYLEMARHAQRNEDPHLARACAFRATQQAADAGSTAYLVDAGLLLASLLTPGDLAIPSGARSDAQGGAASIPTPAK
jgi:hypothetical protein